MKYKRQKQHVVNRILRTRNGEERLVRAALQALDAGCDNVMADLADLLESHPECQERILRAVDDRYNARLA